MKDLGEVAEGLRGEKQELSGNDPACAGWAPGVRRTDTGEKSAGE